MLDKNWCSCASIGDDRLVLRISFSIGKSFAMASQPTPPNVLPARNKAQHKVVINHWFPFFRTPLLSEGWGFRLPSHLQKWYHPKNPDPSRSSRIDGRKIPSRSNRIVGEIPFLGHTNGSLGVISRSVAWKVSTLLSPASVRKPIKTLGRQMGWCSTLDLSAL